MSVVSSAAKRSVRIIALPLTTRLRVKGPAECLTYYHIETPLPAEGTSSSAWASRIQDKAADLWANLGRAPEGNWRRKAFVYGERLIDRVDFDELALKSFDTSLGPSLTEWKTRFGTADIPVIPLIYPSSSPLSPISHLHALLESRIPLHKRGAIIWAVATPLTAPLKLIPIIPNFPFFFCVWRAWSHYRAFKASNYLKSFLERGAILPRPSPELDAIYAEHAPSSTTRPVSAPSTSENSEQHDPHLLLTRAAVPAIAQFLGVPPASTFAADMYRALEQAKLRIEEERTQHG
ncbi:hypothetical protein FOMPIDRAFT_1165413 [Fomitopsis schrenkii]|uniref:Mitochondrial K+-H+ exchange-related-domain-containing protein n=1 Tax=Fomitopsis schrenkii TaxID=2126942 RepID=S8E112_FOMSC|nr:hypothetical protein FOMPIDRAFT_1165413 [Fomitopsis schrenkii]